MRRRKRCAHRLLVLFQQVAADQAGMPWLSSTNGSRVSKTGTPDGTAARGATPAVIGHPSTTVDAKPENGRTLRTPSHG
jgi:hypothetical protein